MPTPTAYGPQLLALESAHGTMAGSEERFAYLAENASYTRGVEQITNPNGTPGILRTCALYSIAASVGMPVAELVDSMEWELRRVDAFGVKIPEHTTYVCRSAKTGKTYGLTDVAFIPDAVTATSMDGDQREHYAQAIHYTYRAMRAYLGCSRNPADLIMRDLNSPRQFAGTPDDRQRLWCLDIGPPVMRRTEQEVDEQLLTHATAWRRFTGLALADYEQLRSVPQL